ADCATHGQSREPRRRDSRRETLDDIRLGRIEPPVRPSLITAVLVAAVLGVSLSGPLVRLSDAQPAAIAAWRLAFSLVIVAVPLVAGGSWRQWRSLDARGVGLALLAGVFLAL